MVRVESEAIALSNEPMARSTTDGAPAFRPTSAASRTTQLLHDEPQQPTCVPASAVWRNWRSTAKQCKTLVLSLRTLPTRAPRGKLLRLALLLAVGLALDSMVSTRAPSKPLATGFTNMVLPLEGRDGVNVHLQHSGVLCYANKIVCTLVIENRSNHLFEDVELAIGFDATILDPNAVASHTTYKAELGSLQPASRKTLCVILPLGYGNRAAPDTFDVILSSGMDTLTARPLMRETLRSFFDRHEVVIAMLSGQGQAKSSLANAIHAYFSASSSSHCRHRALTNTGPADTPHVVAHAQTGFLAEARTFGLDVYNVQGRLFIVDTPGITRSRHKYHDIDDAIARLAVGSYSRSYNTSRPFMADEEDAFSKVVDVVLMPFKTATIGIASEEYDAGESDVVDCGLDPAAEVLIEPEEPPRSLLCTIVWIIWRFVDMLLVLLGVGQPSEALPTEDEATDIEFSDVSDVDVNNGDDGGYYSMIHDVAKLGKTLASQASSRQPTGRQTIVRPCVVVDEVHAVPEVAESYRAQLAAELSVDRGTVSAVRTYHGGRTRRDYRVDLSTHRLLVSIVRSLNGGFDVAPATVYDVVHDTLLAYAMELPRCTCTAAAIAVAVGALFLYNRNNGQ